MIFHFQRLSNYPSIFPKYFDTLLIPFQNKFLESSFKMKNEDVSIHVEIFEKSEEAFSILDRSCTHTHTHTYTMGPHREKSRRTADFGVTRCGLPPLPPPIKALLMQANPGAARNELPL